MYWQWSIMLSADVVIELKVQKAATESLQYVMIWAQGTHPVDKGMHVYTCLCLVSHNNSVGRVHPLFWLSVACVQGFFKEIRWLTSTVYTASVFYGLSFTTVCIKRKNCWFYRWCALLADQRSRLGHMDMSNDILYLLSATSKSISNYFCIKTWQRFTTQRSTTQRSTTRRSTTRSST